jgi:hypothetical protein
MTHVDDLAVIQNEYGLEVKWLSQWHCRIENVLDIWPTAKKFYDLETKARGTYPDLRRFVLTRFESPIAAQCPKCKHPFFHSL